MQTLNDSSPGDRVAAFLAAQSAAVINVGTIPADDGYPESSLRVEDLRALVAHSVTPTVIERILRHLDAHYNAGWNNPDVSPAVLVHSDGIRPQLHALDVDALLNIVAPDHLPTYVEGYAAKLWQVATGLPLHSGITEAPALHVAGVAISAGNPLAQITTIAINVVMAGRDVPGASEYYPDGRPGRD